jgi:hypothetical protein
MRYWGWREKWLNQYICLYMSRPGHFGFEVTLKTTEIGIFLLWFGFTIDIKWGY